MDLFADTETIQTFQIENNKIHDATAVEAHKKERERELKQFLLNGNELIIYLFLEIALRI